MAQIGGRRLVIMGGGIAGLSYLHYLKNFAISLNKWDHISQIILLEADNYMGGSVKSNIFEDGHVHELGPRSIRMAGARAHNTVTLLEQLGLGNKIVSILSSSVAASDRYVYDDQLYKLPDSFFGIFKRLPQSKTTFAHALYRDFKAKTLDLDQFPDRDPSLYQFIEYRFGRDAAEKILDPIMRGITAGDARNLSTRALFGDILNKEQMYGSVMRSINQAPVSATPTDEFYPNEILDSKLLDKLQKERAMSYSLNCGLQTIAEHLSNSLLNTNDDGRVSIYTQTKVKKVEFNTSDSSKAPCSVYVQTIDGDQIVIEADHVISAIPATNFAQTLPQTMPDDQRQALDDIVKIPHVPVGCVCVEYRDLPKPLPDVVNGFGLLTNSKAGRKVLGISFDSSMFPSIDEPFNSTRMTCMIGGAWFKEMVGTDNLDEVKDAHLEQIALNEISDILNIKDEPFRMSTILWKTGIAQYRPGHIERIQRARESIEKCKMPLVLLGQSYDGVAMNDVVFASRMAAYKFIKSL